MNRSPLRLRALALLITLLLAVAGLAGATPGWAAPARALSDGLVAYYSFDDGTAADGSGNGHDGTTYGAQPTPGVAGGAFSFDGNDYIQVPHDPALNLTTAFTISGWVRVRGFQSGWAHILTKSNSSRLAMTPYSVIYGDGGPDGIFPHLRLSGSDGRGVYDNLSIADALWKDRWTFFAWRFSNSQVDFFRDGAMIGSSSPGISTLATNELPLEIGRDLPGQTEFLVGDLDELRIYNRALSDDEIGVLSGQPAAGQMLDLAAAEPGPGLRMAVRDPQFIPVSRELSLDGATWQPYAEPLPAAERLWLRATDAEGDVATLAAQLRQPATKAHWLDLRGPGARYRDVPAATAGVVGVRGTSRIPVVAGARYTMGATVLASDPAIHAVLNMIWLDAQGRRLEHDDTKSAPGATGRFERVVRAPAGAAFVWAEARGRGVGALWVDDVTLVGADGRNLVPDGGFDDDGAWGVVRFLDRLGQAALREHPTSGPALAITIRPTWTSQASRLIVGGRAAGRAGGELRPGAAYPVTPGTRYELALALQGVEVAGTATLELRFYDAAGALLATEAAAAPQGDFGWQWLRVAAAAPAGAASARAALTLAGAGRLWLDTLALLAK